MKKRAKALSIAFAFVHSLLGAVTAQASDGTTTAQTPFTEPLISPFQYTIGCHVEPGTSATSADACSSHPQDLVLVTATADEQGKPLPDNSIPKFDHDALVRLVICNVGGDDTEAPIEIHWDRTGGKANDNPGPGGAKTLEPGYCWGPSTIEEYRDIMVRVKEPGKSATIEWAFYR